MATSERTNALSQPPSWPIEDLYVQLAVLEPEAIVNRTKLGSGAFEGADVLLARIKEAFSDLRLEEWKRIPPNSAEAIPKNLQQFLDLARQMEELDAGAPEQNRVRVRGRFNQIVDVLLEQVEPLCFTARVARAAQLHPELLGGAVTDEQAEALRTEFAQLQNDVKEFRSLSDLMTSMRELVGEQGVTKLSTHFEKLASDAHEGFKRWARALAGVTALGALALVAFVLLTRPADDASNAVVVSHLLLDVLVIGLVVFVIRFTALQARAHRHVEFVARNKANALSTFNLIVTGQTDESVRAQIASALAQAVFASEDGIFADASSDTVTIVERLVGSVGSRSTGGV